MLGKKLKMAFLIYILFYTTNLFAESYLILDDNVNLFNKPKSVNVITKLSFLDTVFSVKKKSVKGNYILIKTATGDKGWIEKKYLTWYDSTWKKFRFANKSSILAPASQKFNFLRSTSFELNGNKFYEYKLHNPNYFIIVTQRRKNIKKIIKSNLLAHDTIYLKKQFKIKHYDATFAYLKSIIDNKNEYIVFTKLDNNTTYTILVDLEHDSQDKDYHLTAKKILFSLELE